MVESEEMNTVRELSADDAAEADALRSMMVGELRSLGAIASEPVADAVRAVPRHLFAPPDEPLNKVYAPTTAIVTKRNAQGAATSSLSESHIQVTMLEQAEITSGMRVLEIGTGGYNAALIAELVGESGHVTSVDIDSDIVTNAKAALMAAGYGEVNVVLADAEHGVPASAPFDRIIVTAGAWDIPPSWIDQLTEDGRLVVPLRMRGLTRSIAFDRDGQRLISRSYRLCGFVPMQGEGAHAERLVPIDGNQIGIRIDSPAEPDVGLGAELNKALAGPRVVHWSDIRFDQVDQLDFFIATSTPEFGLLVAKEGPITRGVVGPAAARGVPTVLRAGSLAYRTKRPILGTEEFETGVIAHGPEAEALTGEFLSLLDQWDRDYRYGGAQIAVYPASTADDDLPAGLILEKVHTRVVVSWP
jgi:protein-L-isoaspartate(D-aspartate) O-methyltransferase